MKLRVGETGRAASKKIREGFRIWKDVEMPEERYREALERFPDGSKGDAWRWIATG